jgi:hypothetical protein
MVGGEDMVSNTRKTEVETGALVADHTLVKHHAALVEKAAFSNCVRLSCF